MTPSHLKIRIYSISRNFLKCSTKIRRIRCQLTLPIFQWLKRIISKTHVGDRLPAHYRDSAVSPVVGIMLMLTITLILAAIISGMTGGIAQSQKKPPQLVFETKLVDEGSESENSFLDINVISVSEGIPSRDLKFQTEWKEKDGTIHRTFLSSGSSGYPLGFGPGVSTSHNFGNYTLLAGTRLHANGTLSGMEALFGPDWKDISEGTPVRIQFIHIPSGAIIADKEITAEI